MKTERYIVEIEMPDGDDASSMYIQDVIQSDCDIEDEGRWKVSVKEYWKPSDLPHWKKSTLPNDNTTGFNSDYFCYKGYYINYKELFEKLPKDDLKN